MTDRSQGKVPLSRHPLFPAIVAGWFGALFGIGGFAVRAAVLENAVLELHIDRLVPAAVPPLGLTARLLVALALMLVGVAAGYVLARLLARAGPRRSDDLASPAAGTVAKAGPEEDDDLARLAAARATQPQRRRALSLDELPEPAPQLRAERTGPSILNVGDLDAISPLTDIAPQPTEPAPVPAVAEQAAPAPEPAAATAERPRAAPLASLGVTELVERFARALASAHARRPRASAEPVAARAPEADAPAAPPSARFLDDSRPLAAAQPLSGGDTRPFAMPPSLREPGLGNIEWFDEAEEEATLESLLPPKRVPVGNPFKTAAAFPAEPADEPADETARWALPELDEDEADLETSIQAAADDDARFSSLLDMEPSTRQPAPLGSFVRIEDHDMAEIAEPVVIFPGQSVPPPAVPARLPGTPFGAGPVATEAALREALMALQKMSGTG